MLAEYNNNPFDIKAFCVKPQDIVVYHFRILAPRILVCQCFVTKSQKKTPENRSSPGFLSLFGCKIASDQRLLN